MTEVITFVWILRAKETKRIIQNSMQCYTKAYMGFIKHTARDDAGYLLTVRCGELWVVPSSVNGLIKSDVSCYAQSLYSALKWQNLTCRQNTRASGLLLNAIFALIIIVWSGTGWLHLKSYLVPQPQWDQHHVFTLYFGVWFLPLRSLVLLFAYSLLLYVSA